MKFKDYMMKIVNINPLEFNKMQNKNLNKTTIP